MDIEDVLEEYETELEQLGWGEDDVFCLGNQIELELLVTSLTLQRQVNELRDELKSRMCQFTDKLAAVRSVRKKIEAHKKKQERS